MIILMITGGQKYESKQFRKGLEYIYLLSKNPDVFNTFGNDIIQCFYDLSKVIQRFWFHIGLS